MHTKFKTIILDDDPTGIQTVHDCLAVTDWKKSTIRTALNDEEDFFYILTNARALGPDKAREQIRGAVEAVCSALEERESAERRRESSEEEIVPVFVARGDSTLRGHFPLEVETIRESLEACGRQSRFDAVFLIPAFFEAGRYTRDDTHYLIDAGKELKTSDSEFARDSVFAYRDSHLPSYIEEKTGGRVRAEEVASVSLELLRNADSGALEEFLDGLEAERYVVVNCSSYEDLDRFTAGARRAIERGKRFLFHSSSSFPKSFNRNPDRGLIKREELKLREGHGLVVVGSHVPKTTRQLYALLDNPTTSGIELDVEKVLSGGESRSRERERILGSIAGIHQEGLTPVLYTPREELSFGNAQERLDAGTKISAFLVEIVGAKLEALDFLVSKGGITSHDILVSGLGPEFVRVLGQVHPGVPAVELPAGHPSEGMPYVIFPGNVGDDTTLELVYRTYFQSRR
jgi:uncharacterized protein YgbK (DUF1537 family)